MPKTPDKRKKTLINSRLQLRLVGTFLAVACLAALFQVSLLNMSMMNLVHETPPETSELLLMRIPRLLAENVALTLGVLLPLMIAIGVQVTHRVAGPAHSIEQYLRRIADGNIPENPCRIREGDELSGLCEALNLAVARLSANFELGRSYDEASRSTLDRDDAQRAHPDEHSQENPPSLVEGSDEQSLEQEAEQGNVEDDRTQQA